MANIVWLTDVSSEDVGIVGYKGSKLCSLYQNGFFIPQCFVVTIQAFQYFLEHRGLNNEIIRILRQTLDDKESLLNAEDSIQDLILKSELPDAVRDDINYAYEHMDMNTDIFKMLNKNALNFIKAGRNLPYTAIRPSFNKERLKGKYFINIKGREALINSIKQTWASFFNVQNLSILKNDGIDSIGIAVIIQKMINSEKYAVVNVNQNELNINCVYGLGETFSIAVPDSYLINANSLEVINKVVNKQESMFIRDDNYGRTLRKGVNLSLIDKEKLTSDEIRKISNFSLSVFQHYNKNVSVELALENGKFYLIDVKEPSESQPEIFVQEPQNESAGQNIFSMFNENPVNYGNAENETSNLQNYEQNIAENRASMSSKVPISFDIKITDQTNIEELKAKLKAIKEFINKEL